MKDENEIQETSLLFLKLGELLEKYTFIVPAFQRNYVWSQEEVHAVIDKLIKNVQAKEEIIGTLGMITLYQPRNIENNDVEVIYNTNKKEMWLIDGQQRLITLRLLFQWLYVESSQIPLKISFERDNDIKDDGKKRDRYIQNLGDKKIIQEPFSVDTKRFQNNFDSIGKIKYISDCQEGLEKKHSNDVNNQIIRKILKNVRVIVHISYTNPNAEFLNINAKKNRFSLSDYAKTYMMIAMDGEEKVIALFKDLSKELYKEDQWKILRRNYDSELEKIKSTFKNGVENKLDILFIDRYDKDSVEKLIDKNNAKKEFERLELFLRMIKEMFAYISNFNGFVWLSSKRIYKKKFFSLFKGDIGEYVGKSFSYVLINTLTKRKIDCNKMNSFLQVQLLTEKIEETDYLVLDSNNNEYLVRKFENQNLIIEMLKKNMEMLVNIEATKDRR